MLNGILKGDYHELLDVIAYETHRPTIAPQKLPLPQDLPPPPLLSSCGGWMEQIGRGNSLHKAVVHLPDRGRACELDCS